MCLCVQTWPLPSPLTLQRACSLLAEAGKTELLKVSNLNEIPQGKQKWGGFGSGPSPWVSI